MPDGTWRFLPFDYSRQKQAFFCNTIARGNRGWVPISPALAITDCVDWPPTRVIGDEPRFSNCQSCHGSQVRVALDTTARAYRTDIESLGINCESCHGPGATHLARAARPRRRRPRRRRYARAGHAHKGPVVRDVLPVPRPEGPAPPGLRRQACRWPEYYSIRLPQLGDEALLPDGRVRTFAYQEGHLYSDCYRNGGMTCTSCHDPHSQEYRDVTGSPLPGRFDDHQCTSCHASKADSVSRHTRHASDSPGSRCTACHMPYLQQPELGTAIPYARSDHSIPIPRPFADSALGIVERVQGVPHRPVGERVAGADVQRLYGDLKPLPAAVDALNRARAGVSRAEAGTAAAQA